MNQIEYTERIIDGFRRMAAKVVKRRTWGVLDAEDLVQVGLMSTLRPSSSPMLRAWGAMIGELRRHKPYYFKRHRGAGFMRFVGLEKSFKFRQDPSTPNYAQDLWGGVRKVVGVEVGGILQAFFSGSTQDEIAVEVRVSPSHVSKLIQRAILKLQRAWSDQPIQRRPKGEKFLFGSRNRLRGVAL